MLVPSTRSACALLPHLKWCRMALSARPSAQLVVKFSTLTSGYGRVHWRTQLSKIFSLLVCCRLDMMSFMMSLTYMNMKKHMSVGSWYITALSQTLREVMPRGVADGILLSSCSYQGLILSNWLVKRKDGTQVWICVLTCQWRIILQMRPNVSLWFPSTISVPPMFTRSTCMEGG